MDNSQFYITLPSNASLDIFPENTQSHFRTKLLQPVSLSGSWEVGLAEIVIPKNWFNINHHNNYYSIINLIEKRKVISRNNFIFNIPIPISDSRHMSDFFDILNGSINDIVKTDVIKFILSQDKKEVSLIVDQNFEIEIKDNIAPKLISILNLPKENITISTNQTFQVKPKSSHAENQYFTIKQKFLPEHVGYKVSLPSSLMGDDILEELNFQINVHTRREYGPPIFKWADNRIIEITLREGDELHIRKNEAPSLLEMLTLPYEDIIVRKSRLFDYTPVESNILNEYFYISFSDPEFKTLTQHVKNFSIEEGLYDHPQDLFSQFNNVGVRLLRNNKISITVPPEKVLMLGDGLRDLLGFDYSRFDHGDHISKYQLELDGGITEIFVYSDVVESHHVGNTLAPVLRVIPVKTGQKHQISKTFHSPIYFPVRKHYFDVIEIEMRDTLGRLIGFTSGKTLVTLSFRQRSL